jgi:hypothetical protein
MTAKGLAAILMTPLFVYAAQYVEVSMPSDGHPLVEYHFPPGSRPTFVGRPEWQEEVRRPFWVMDYRCYQLGVNEVIVKAQDCPDNRIGVTWDEAPRDRMYPAVVTLQNGGVLIYAPYVEVLSADKRSVETLRIRAPAHGVAVFRGQKTSGELVLDGTSFRESGDGWIYLGPDEFSQDTSNIILTDRGVPDSISGQVATLTRRLLELYSRKLGIRDSNKPTIYLVWSQREKPQRTAQADVIQTGDIRFTISGSGWKEPSDAALTSLSLTLAHELAHLWNLRESAHPRWAASWVAEGGSELLALSALLELNRVDMSASTQRVNSAYAECAVIASGRAWKDIPDRQSGRTPYACGLALEFAITAALKEEDPALDSFTLWRRLLSQHIPLYEASFEQYAVGNGHSELAGLLKQTFTQGLSLDSALLKLYRAAELNVKPATDLSPSVGSMLGAQLVAAIMAADCNGSYSVYRRDDAFLIDYPRNVVACGTIKSGMQIRRVQAIDPLSEPLAAVAAVERACASAGKIELGLLDSSSVQSPCPRPASVATAARIVELDPAEVGRILSSAGFQGPDSARLGRTGVAGASSAGGSTMQHTRPN